MSFPSLSVRANPDKVDLLKEKFSNGKNIGKATAILMAVDHALICDTSELSELSVYGHFISTKTAHKILAIHGIKVNVRTIRRWCRNKNHPVTGIKSNDDKAHWMISVKSLELYLSGKEIKPNVVGIESIQNNDEF